MSDSDTRPAIHRQNQLNDQHGKRMREITSINANDNVDQTIQTDHGEFDNFRWVSAEVDDLRFEMDHLTAIMTVNGDVLYDK